MQGLTHISQTLKETDQLLERHLDGYHRVYRHYEPYDPEEWMKLLKDVHRTFGRPSDRWQWSHVITTLTWDKVGGENNWHIIFHFLKESDAIMFALKY